MTATSTPQLETLPPQIAEFCERAVEALRAKLPVREVWLFGSNAEGTAKPESDVDLFVVLADGHGLKNPKAACSAALEGIRPQRRRVDIHTLTESYWHHPRYRNFGLWSDVAEKGICLCESGEFFQAPATDLPLMPGDHTVPESWFEKARRDLKTAKVVLSNDDIENALILLEQSVEKLFKGWLIERGWKLERTHALADLLAEVEVHGVPLRWFADDADTLSKAFWLMRYPSDEPTPSIAESETIFSNTERLFSELGITL